MISTYLDIYNTDPKIWTSPVDYVRLCLRRLYTFGRISASSAKEDNFCDFLFALLHAKPLVEKCLL